MTNSHYKLLCTMCHLRLHVEVTMFPLYSETLWLNSQLNVIGEAFLYFTSAFSIDITIKVNMIVFIVLL